MKACVPPRQPRAESPGAAVGRWKVLSSSLMSTWFLGGALALALIGALSVVAFESPTRSAGGLITAFLGAAAAAGALGAPLVPGFLLWVGAGGIGLLLLASVLLLNLRPEERGPRRLRLRPLVAVPALVVLAGALAAWVLEAVRGTAAQSRAPLRMPRLTDADVSAAVAGPLGVHFSVALIALAAALVVAIALVRRRT